MSLPCYPRREVKCAPLLLLSIVYLSSATALCVADFFVWLPRFRMVITGEPNMNRCSKKNIITPPPSHLHSFAHFSCLRFFPLPRILLTECSVLTSLLSASPSLCLSLQSLHPVYFLPPFLSSSLPLSSASLRDISIARSISLSSSSSSLSRNPSCVVTTTHRTMSYGQTWRIVAPRSLAPNAHEKSDQVTTSRARMARSCHLISFRSFPHLP